MVTNSTPHVDRDFIRRAIELADLNAVRVALYQHTHDPEIEALPKALLMTPEDRELLVTRPPTGWWTTPAPRRWRSRRWTSCDIS